MNTIAIIGTAGRKDDAKRINPALYDAMYEQSLEAIRDWNIEAGVSGGAAVADHLCVRAFLEGAISSLTLYLPARFENGKFVPNPRIQFNPGATCNQYHAQFSRTCGLDSLGQIAQAIERGAKIEVHEGFHRRNLEVAGSCSHMLAFTFGNDVAWTDIGPNDEAFKESSAAGLKDGGTAHTWRECWKANVKRHVSLTRLEHELTATRTL